MIPWLGGVLLAALASAMSATTVAMAQPAPPPITIPGAGPPEGDAPRGGPGDHGPRAQRLFISPSGEPFRGPNGFEAWFAGADANHDGAITFEEFRADAQRAFRLYDTDGDGRLDGFEIQAYERERAPEIAQMTVEAGGRARGGGRHRSGSQDGSHAAADNSAPVRPAGRLGAARFSLLNEPQPLAQADLDLDGKVSADEWARTTTRRFETLDHDKTGRLTRDSLKGVTPKK